MPRNDVAKRTKLVFKTFRAPLDWLVTISAGPKRSLGLRGSSPLLDQQFDRGSEQAECSVRIPAGRAQKISGSDESICLRPRPFLSSHHVLVECAYPSNRRER
jgi:hypothetical protein